MPAGTQSDSLISPRRVWDHCDVMLRSRAAIVGVGRTEFFRRGRAAPLTTVDLAVGAALDAIADAGLQPSDVDGFSYFNYDERYGPHVLAPLLGVDEIRFASTATGGGNGSAAAIGNAAAAIATGQASVVVTVMALNQDVRYGARAAVETQPPGLSAEADFYVSQGLIGAAQMMAMFARRHMYEYGTRREHFGEVVLSARENAASNPRAIRPERVSVEDYLAARSIAEPLNLFDCCGEDEGAVACVTVGSDRARDLPHPPALILSSAHGGYGRWGRAFQQFAVPAEYFASSGARLVADRVYHQAGVGPGEIDVALLYDHFSPAVLLQLEDFGFCNAGEAGAFVEDGPIRWPDGRLPVNPHGGHLAEAYIVGMTHVAEAVEQIRGTAINQVAGAEIALVTGGMSSGPTSALILGKTA